MGRNLEQLLGKFIPEGVRDEQLEALEKERDRIETDRREAKIKARDLLRRQARILVLDLSQGTVDTGQFDPQVLKELSEQQFGGGKLTNGQILRNMLGLKKGDPQVDIWRVPQDTGRANLPHPETWDAWMATGGPAMPSELEEGNETENTPWLRRATDAMTELTKAGVPGVAVCLSHQLFERSRGAQVGRRHPKREFGTVEMQGTDIGKELQLLYGFWDEAGKVDISASHSEAVTTPPPSGEHTQVIAFNDYSDYQGAIHSLRPDQPVQEAARQDQIVLSLQNHPEILAMYLTIFRHLHALNMKQEGLDPQTMVFRGTPNARRIWANFVELVARRIEKRKK